MTLNKLRCNSGSPVFTQGDGDHRRRSSWRSPRVYHHIM